MNCPFCRQVIRDAAIKCRFCGEILDAKIFEAERARITRTAAAAHPLAAAVNPRLKPPPQIIPSSRGITPKQTVAIGIGVVFLTILGALFSPKAAVPEEQRGSERHDVASRPRRQTDRQLITERAQLLHGRNARVEVIGGFYGGSYQVNVWSRITGGIYDGGYDRFSYTATVDERRQCITSWELYDHN